MHQAMAATLERAIADIRAEQRAAREVEYSRPFVLLMIVFCPLRGDGPDRRNRTGIRSKGSGVCIRCRAPTCGRIRRICSCSRTGRRATGRTTSLRFEWADSGQKVFGRFAPLGARRMSANPHVTGGLLRKDLKLPDIRRYAVEVPALVLCEPREHQVGEGPARRATKLNPANFRRFGLDATTASNRLQAVYEASKKTWMAETSPEDLDGGASRATAASWRCSPSTR